MVGDRSLENSSQTSAPKTVDRERNVAAEPPSESLTGQMAAGLHLAVRRTGRTPVDDITVVTENARELLCDVCAAVSTASACRRRFHGLPVLLGGFHGWGVVRGRAVVSHGGPTAAGPAARPLHSSERHPIEGSRYE